MMFFWGQVNYYLLQSPSSPHFHLPGNLINLKVHGSNLHTVYPPNRWWSWCHKNIFLKTNRLLLPHKRLNHTVPYIQCILRQLAAQQNLKLNGWSELLELRLQREDFCLNYNPTHTKFQSYISCVLPVKKVDVVYGPC